ncbi:uroporphyrinogen-III synthase [Methanosphaerula palustris]|uniref:Uroporphyrinogen-III synthase-like protein n=1 Tax=Methanosphaerula palustris (strain ATCC BAA-1556 / DSM 19958 / E1-9c) TaxID=521011 RepID=B8GFX8_METPE|nr:uroporphyrinogen-III synthase [Methanosphaerula palustris]ACL18011.1 uroporphyrinogen-III synthase-like protein [Methanosphaerula palustris E1-9c]
MKIAITRLAGKEENDAARCNAFGHTSEAVSPLRAEVYADQIEAFVQAVTEGQFDCLFFTSALPAQLIGPHLNTWPRVVAIGPTTAATLQQHGIPAETLSMFYSREFVPYLGSWISMKTIGIPRADVPNQALLDSITGAGGIPREFRCYGLVKTGEPLQTADAGAILFTSAMSYREARWTPRPDLLVGAIGEVTADAVRAGGTPVDVIGDGSLEGFLTALNRFIEERS